MMCGGYEANYPPGATIFNYLNTDSELGLAFSLSLSLDLLRDVVLVLIQYNIP